MKKKDVAANKGDRIVQFKHADAQRIASVVHEVESARRGRNPSKLPRASGGGGGVFEASFCGAWPKGEIKQITLSGGSTSTANAINSLCSIQPVNTGENYTRLCYVTRNGSDAAEYALLNAEC